MNEIRVLVAAAGRGTRSGLPYPKALFYLQGKPILVRILELLLPYDEHPSVVVSPGGEGAIQNCLVDAGRDAFLVVQPTPVGMGDAVLCFYASPAFASAEHILLVWGDIPFIQPETVAALVSVHLTNRNDFTFVTRMVECAYTMVSRSDSGHVSGVLESRESGVVVPGPGERDIGLFVFRKNIVMPMLREELAGKWGSGTGEHGFLYIIGHLAKRGFRVEALPIGTELEIVSLNSIKDVIDFM